MLLSPDAGRFDNPIVIPPAPVAYGTGEITVQIGDVYRTAKTGPRYEGKVVVRSSAYPHVIEDDTAADPTPNDPVKDLALGSLEDCNEFSFDMARASLGVSADCALEVTKWDGSAATGNTEGTGDTVKALDAEGNVVASAGPVIVFGDVLGTGKMSLTQVIAMAQAFQGTRQLEGPFLKAADLNGDGALKLSDLVLEAQWLME